MIRVGVAGWDYPDWEGIVYPAATPRGFDRLAWVARFVDVVEINATFYRPAAPRTAASWARRVADRPGFRFTAKSHRSWTHEAATPDPAAIASTLDGLAPLREAGLLDALLVQFPQAFHHAATAVERIAFLAERAAGWPLVVEVRHASWDDDAAEASLRGLGVGWCVVDQPRIGRSTLAVTARITSSVAYLRLHGRNAADWFREGAGRDARYDYLYSVDELRSLAVTAQAMAAASRSLVVVQNNHFRGQALANALQMKRLLQGTRPRAPRELVDRYPAIEAEVEVERTTLF